GLTQAMQAELGCTRDQMSHVIRIMRADLAVWSTQTWDEDLVRGFRAAAALFLRVHGPRSWRVLWHRNDLVNYACDKHTIDGFYYAMHHTAGSRTRASCLPDELEVFTPLDRQSL